MSTANRRMVCGDNVGTRALREQCGSMSSKPPALRSDAAQALFSSLFFFFFSVSELIRLEQVTVGWGCSI